MTREAIHPGKFLRAELVETGTSPIELAQALNVPSNRIYQILNGRRAITADTALCFSQWLGTSADFWLNLQKIYELRLAESNAGKEIKSTIVRWHAPQQE